MTEGESFRTGNFQGENVRRDLVRAYIRGVYSGSPRRRSLQVWPVNSAIIDPSDREWFLNVQPERSFSGRVRATAACPARRGGENDRGQNPPDRIERVMFKIVFAIFYTNYCTFIHRYRSQSILYYSLFN